MMNDLVKMLYKATPRDKMEAFILSHGYAEATLKDIMAEAGKLAAKKFTQDEVELAKQQIKQLSEDIMGDEEEMSLARIKAAELLGKLMRAFQPEIAIQNNTTNNLNLSELTTEQISKILNERNE